MSPDPSNPREVAFSEPSEFTTDGQKPFSMAWIFYQVDVKAL
jgi:hypothetical protein